MTVAELIGKLQALPAGAVINVGVDVIEGGHEGGEATVVELDGKDVWIE